MDIYNLREDDAKKILFQHGLSKTLKQGNSDEIPPKYDDLARLYFLVRERKPFQVLEFGSGFSTLVIALALSRNWLEYLEIARKEESLNGDSLYHRPNIVSVESSDMWRSNTIEKVRDAGFSEFSKVVCSEISIAEYEGQICHFYDKLPDVVPDFVYLDGPDPSDVRGDINGLSFQNPARTVMSGDVLKYESTILPGFFLIVDGRTNNARFLSRMLKRDYEINYHQNADVTTFELKETRLGRKNIFGHEAYSGLSIKFGEGL